MRHARPSFTSRGVNEDQIVTIGNSNRVSIGHDEIRNAFVGAFVTPQNFAATAIDRTHAIRSTLDRLAILQTRELPASTHQQNISNYNHLGRESEIFSLPLCIATLPRDGPHASVTGNVD